MTARCICDPWAPYEDCPIHGQRQGSGKDEPDDELGDR